MKSIKDHPYTSHTGFKTCLETNNIPNNEKVLAFLGKLYEGIINKEYGTAAALNKQFSDVSLNVVSLKGELVAPKIGENTEEVPLEKKEQLPLEGVENPNAEDTKIEIEKKRIKKK